MGGSCFSSPLMTMRLALYIAGRAFSTGSCEASSNITRSKSPCRSGKIWDTVSGLASQTGQISNSPRSSPSSTTSRSFLALGPCSMTMSSQLGRGCTRSGAAGVAVMLRLSSRRWASCSASRLMRRSTSILDNSRAGSRASAPACQPSKASRSTVMRTVSARCSGATACQ